MKSALKYLIASIVLFVIAISSVAQTPTPSPVNLQPAPPRISQEAREKAFKLAEEVLKDADALTLDENRVRARIYAADLIWEQNPDLARRVFREAVDAMTALVNQPPSDDPDFVRMLIDAGKRGSKLRQEIVALLSKHDVKLAREVMRKSRQGDDDPGAYPWQREGGDRAIELGLAKKLIDTDPKQATEIVIEMLERPMGWGLIDFVTALEVKDPALAREVAAAIVVKLKTGDEIKSDAGRNAAIELWKSAIEKDKPVEDGAPNGSTAASKRKEPLLDQSAMRDLTEMILAVPVAEDMYGGTSSTQLIEANLDEVAKYSPSRAAEIRRRKEERERRNARLAKALQSARGSDDAPAESPQGEGSLDQAELDALQQKGDADAILKAIPNAESWRRDRLAQMAADAAAQKGDYDRARQIIGEYVRNPTQRTMMLKQLEQQMLMKAITEGRITEAEKLIANLRNNEERALALAQLAGMVFTKGNSEAAKKLLENARALVAYRAKTFVQMVAQLEVARTYARVDPSASVEMLGPVVDQVDELIAAGMVIGGFISNEVVRDNEINLEIAADALPALFEAYGFDISLVSRSEFGKMAALAGRFQRNEVRIAAKLLIAKSILAPPAEKRTESGDSVRPMRRGVIY